MAESSLLVTGASAPTPDVRGVYFKTGSDYAGQPIYKHSSLSFYCWFNSDFGNVWVINDQNGGGFYGNAFTLSGTSKIGTYNSTGTYSGSVTVADGGDLRYLIKEKDSKEVTFGLAGIPRTKQLVRRWDKIKDKKTRECLDFLDTWTSAENYNEQFYVDSPYAVGERGAMEFPGRWRLVSLSRTNDYPEGLTQILRLGFQKHSGSASDPLDQDEARLGIGVGNTVTGDRVYRQDWRYTDPSDHKEILKDLTAISSVTNPTVEGEEITGKFACSKITSQPNEDGSIIISRTLTEMHSITTLEHLSNLSPIITQEQELINLFGFESGDEEKLLYLYSNIDPASQAYCSETLTPVQLATIPGGTWLMYDRKFVVDKESGVASFAVLYMKETWDADYDDRNTVRGGTLSGWLRNIVLQATGESQTQALADFQLVADETGNTFSAGTQYNKGDTTTYSGDQYIFIEPHLGAWVAADAVEAHYLLNGRTLQHRGRGEYVVTGDMVAAYDGTSAADAIVLRAGDAFTETDRRVGVRVWFRRSKEAFETITDPATGEAWQDWTYDSDTYYSHNWSAEDHQNGTYTIRQFGWILTDDDDDDGFLARIKPGITVADQEMIIRSWPNLTLTAKDLLIADGGKARSDYTIGAPIYSGNRTFTHADCFVEDRTEAGYTVRQVLVYLNDYADTDARNTAALVIKIKPNVTPDQQRMIVRVWATVSEAEKDTLVAAAGVARSDYTFESVLYTHADCFIDDRGRAGYTVRQILMELKTGTTDGDALITRQKNQLGSSPAVLQRVWVHRTETAKNTLIAAGTGKARLNYTNESVLYQHLEYDVDDLGNGGYNVRQTLIALGGSWSNPSEEFDLDYPVIKTESRTRDDKTKEYQYTKYIAMRRSEEDAWDYIDGKVGTEGVAGSDHVVKKGRYQYLATVLLLDAVTAWA